MAIPLPTLKARYFDQGGAPLAGGLLYTYVAGSATPLATYTDSAGNVPNANPVVLDGNGQADVWLGVGIYKFILKDYLENILWSEDNVQGEAGSGTGGDNWITHAVINNQSQTALGTESVDLAVYSSSVWNCEIIRGSTVFSNLQVAIQSMSGIGRAITGLAITNEQHGVTFDLTQSGTICTLTAALTNGLGDGTVKLQQKLLVPV
jgi:hypothetical protein